jgi:hypothetical protein
MKKIFIIVVLLITLFAIGTPIYANLFKDQHDIKSEMKQLLLNKKSNDLKMVSYNDETYYFLKKTKFKQLSNLSDSQGEIGRNTFYYAGRIGKTSVAFKVHKNTDHLFRKIVPIYEIDKISINNNPF